MSTPLLIDLSHTSHTRARTGIQRVTRSLLAALEPDAAPITHDPYAQRWRALESWERANLAATEPTEKRGARWPWPKRVRGRMTRWMSAETTSLPPHAGLVVPEVFSPGVATALPELFAATSGPRVALFHDAIALKLPELTPTKTVARFPAYLVELLAFDGIAAVSEDSRAALVDYWRWLGVRDTPVVEALPLGTEMRREAPGTTPNDTSDPIVLSIGSIEGRKNHLALLEACERLWSRGARFSLRLIGLAQPQTGRAALERIRALQAAGRPLRYDGAVADAVVEAAYAECAFTVYPSLLEGFGLPVIESLAHGKPCICSRHGALGEVAIGGGCVALATVDADSLAHAIERLLAPVARDELALAARARRFPSWREYASALREWMQTVPRRNTS